MRTTGRVVLFPTGTSLLEATMAVTASEAAEGRTIANPRILTSYTMPWVDGEREVVQGPPFFVAFAYDALPADY